MVSLLEQYETETQQTGFGNDPNDLTNPVNLFKKKHLNWTVIIYKKKPYTSFVRATFRHLTKAKKYLKVKKFKSSKKNIFLHPR